MSDGIRLQLYMSCCGVASRRRCEEMIGEGRVTVNGKRAAIGSKVLPSDLVCLDRRKLVPVQKKLYIVVNKPRGFLCSDQAAGGKPLVKDILKRIPYRLFHVGRLDFLSSGLIFYTNDGRFARKVSHPSSGIEKEYLVETAEEVPEDILRRYQAGITIAQERYRLKRYRYKTPRQALLTLVEGKNREIRKVFETFRLSVKNIHRIRIGCVTAKNLPLGGYRNLERAEVAWFLERGKG